MTTQKFITINQLAEELFIGAKSLRKRLRDNKIEKPGKHWTWPEDHPTVELIRNWENKPKTKKAAAKQIEADIEMEMAMDAELEEFGEDVELSHPEPHQPLVYVEYIGAWTITHHEEFGVKAEAGKDKTKWMNELSDIRPSLPKKVKTHIEGLLK